MNKSVSVLMEVSTLVICSTQKTSSQATFEIDLLKRSNTILLFLFSKLGYQGGNVDSVIRWSRNLRLWFHSRKLEGTFNFERIAISRYWNAFGLSEVAPKQNSMFPIVCEINPPLEGLDKRVQDAFARGESCDVWLLHRGKIGDGKLGIGRKLFFENFQIEVGEIAGDKFAIIDDIRSPDFVEHVRGFVQEVGRIKNL